MKIVKGAILLVTFAKKRTNQSGLQAHPDDFDDVAPAEGMADRFVTVMGKITYDRVLFRSTKSLSETRRALLADDQFDKAGLPVLAFNDRATVHLNGLTLDLIHFASAQTVSDAMEP